MSNVQYLKLISFVEMLSVPLKKSLPESIKIKNHASQLIKLRILVTDVVSAKCHPFVEFYTSAKSVKMFFLMKDVLKMDVIQTTPSYIVKEETAPGIRLQEQLLPRYPKI